MSAEAGVLRGGAAVAGIEVRVLKTEAHSLTSTPTQYAVESGKTIIDHVTLNPNTIQFRCEMTNADSGTEEARNVLAEFVRMQEQRQPMQLLTEHASYKNMVLIGILPVHQAPYKGALVFDLRFHQVGIVGEAGLVSKSGGRSTEALAKDGTQATACGYFYAGEVRPIASGSLLTKCGNMLGRYSTRCRS